MARILIVQSRISDKAIERERGNFTRTVGGLAELEFLSALDERLAWHSPDDFLKDANGVIFGGSSDADFDGGRDARDPARVLAALVLSRTKNIITHAESSDIPIFGVCFGHQLIAQMHGGEVSNDKVQSKFGSYAVELTEEGKRDPLFSKLPANFFAQYAHKDSATNLPHGAKLMATGPACRFSALRYGDYMYTTQFHPEVERMMPARFHESPEASHIIPLWIEHFVA